MLFVAILASVACVALSVPPPCVVGPWSEWSECKRNDICEPHEVPKSYPVSDEQKAKGEGRRAMQKLIWMKTKAHQQRQACRADSSCPIKMSRVSITGGREACENGMANGEYPCNNVDILSFLNHEDLGYPTSEGNDMWVWHDSESEDNYVLMGHTTGTTFIRITDPINPVILGKLDTHTVSSSWRDMKVIGNYAYIVSEATDHGMQVFDLNQLRDLEQDNTRVFTTTAHYDLVGNTHNIAANAETNTVFLVGSTHGEADGKQLCDGGLHMVDVSDPMNPTMSGCYGGDGYVHDTECFNYDGPDSRYTGQEICFCYNEDTFTIVDVTNRENPDLLSRNDYNGSAYTHQGWVTPNRKFAVMNDELDERISSDKFTRTYVWNIENLEAPVLVDLFLSSETSIDHNLYIDEDYWVHQSNYEAGYRLLKIDENNGVLAEHGFLDVYPDRTSAEFFGTWSNYPWLKDSNDQTFVALSSIDYGLYLLQPNWDQIEVEMAQSGHQTRSRDVVHNPQGAQCPALEETQPCQATGC